MKNKVSSCLCIVMLITIVFTLNTSVYAEEIQSPDIPTLTGPTEGNKETTYDFTASTLDPQGEYISYMFDWGEGNNTGWLMPYVELGEEATASFSWNEYGEYNVTVKAKDVHGHESESSEIHVISIVNRAPKTPTITGTAFGTVDVAYTYLFTAEDPDGDDVSYYIDWGDGTNSSWMPLSISGKTMKDIHVWDAFGEYPVKIKTKDEYGLESNWSKPMTVTIGSLDITGITGGFGLKINIKNGGHVAKDVDYNVQLIGGTFPGLHFNKKYENTVLLLPEETTIVNIPKIFGLGDFTIVITIDCAGEHTIEKEIDAKILFFYVLM